MKAKVTIDSDLGGNEWMGHVEWPYGAECLEQHTYTTKEYKRRSGCVNAVNKFLKRNGLEIHKDNKHHKVNYCKTKGGG